MSANILYRINANAPIPTLPNQVKGSLLTNEEVDGNFRSVQQAISTVESNLNSISNQASADAVALAIALG